MRLATVVLGLLFGIPLATAQTHQTHPRSQPIPGFTWLLTQEMQTLSAS
ncbi:MAG: hypothetical protein ACR2PF_13995 [Rhizobiaceae bacterium]